MEKIIRKMELLSPAGSMEALKAAVSAGCDAIYIGGSRFGARAYADNPEEDSLISGIRYAHRHNVKIYLTVNTLVKETERASVIPFLTPYYEAGLDAVIVQDLGVMREISEAFPDLVIHASTQMSIWQEKAAALLPKQVTRIVPARELSVGEMRDLAAGTGLETEVFVHGALCYCYSGQCLMSSMIGGRSGNRGRCAQPCRKEYRYSEHFGDERNGAGKREYTLNLRDQCLLSKLPELWEAGVDSLKIEGRMKRPEYTAVVTSVYRKWLDRLYSLGPERYRVFQKEHETELREDIRKTEDIFSRGEFSEGYFSGMKTPDSIIMTGSGHVGTKLGEATVTGHGPFFVTPSFSQMPEAGDLIVLRAKDRDGILVEVGELTMPKDMAGYRPKSVPIRWDRANGPKPLTVSFYRVRREALEKSLTEAYLNNYKTEPVSAFFYAACGEHMSLTLTGERFKEPVSVTVTGAPTEAAKGAPGTEEQVLRGLKKTGGTELTFSDITVSLGDNCFLPVSAVNAIRRQAIEAYLSELDRLGTRTKEAKVLPDATLPKSQKPCVVYTTATPEQAGAVIRYLGKNPQENGYLFADMEGNAEQSLRFAEYAGEAVTLGILLPRVTKGNRLAKVKKELDGLLERFPVKGVMVRGLDQLAMVKELAFSGSIFTDSSIPVMNERTCEVLTEWGVSRMSLSPELRREEITAPMAGCGLLTVYGRTAVMVSEQCVSRNNGRCDKAGRLMALTDCGGAAFPVKAVCKYCYNVIYNGPVLSLLGLSEIRAFSGIRYDFTLENAAETEAALCGREGELFELTRGHFRRGVE